MKKIKLCGVYILGFSAWIGTPANIYTCSGSNLLAKPSINAHPDVVLYTKTFGNPESQTIEKLLIKKAIDQKLILLVPSITDNPHDLDVYLDNKNITSKNSSDRHLAYIYGYEDTAAIALKTCSRLYMDAQFSLIEKSDGSQVNFWIGLENFIRSPEFRHAWLNLKSKSTFASKPLFLTIDREIQRFKKIPHDIWSKNNPQFSSADYYSMTPLEISQLQHELTSKFNLAQNIPIQNTLENWLNLYRDLFFATMILLPESERLDFNNSIQFFKPKSLLHFANNQQRFIQVFNQWEAHRQSIIVQKKIDFLEGLRAQKLPIYVLLNPNNHTELKNFLELDGLKITAKSTQDLFAQFKINRPTPPQNLPVHTQLADNKLSTSHQINPANHAKPKLHTSSLASKSSFMSSPSVMHSLESNIKNSTSRDIPPTHSDHTPPVLLASLQSTPLHSSSEEMIETVVDFHSENIIHSSADEKIVKESDDMPIDITQQSETADDFALTEVSLDTPAEVTEDEISDEDECLEPEDNITGLYEDVKCIITDKISLKERFEKANFSEVIILHPETSLVSEDEIDTNEESPSPLNTKEVDDDEDVWNPCALDKDEATKGDNWVKLSDEEQLWMVVEDEADEDSYVKEEPEAECFDDDSEGVESVETVEMQTVTESPQQITERQPIKVSNTSTYSKSRLH